MALPTSRDHGLNTPPLFQRTAEIRVVNSENYPGTYDSEANIASVRDSTGFYKKEEKVQEKY